MISEGMYNKKVTFKTVDDIDVSLVLKPLPATYIVKLYKIIDALGVKGDSEIPVSEMVSKLANSPELLLDVIDVCKKTLKISSPELTDNAIDEFVSVNMFVVLPLVFETNFRK